MNRRRERQILEQKNVLISPLYLIRSTTSVGERTRGRERRKIKRNGNWIIVLWLRSRHVLRGEEEKAMTRTRFIIIIIIIFSSSSPSSFSYCAHWASLSIISLVYVRTPHSSRLFDWLLGCEKRQALVERNRHVPDEVGKCDYESSVPSVIMASISPTSSPSRGIILQITRHD